LHWLISLTEKQTLFISMYTDNWQRNGELGYRRRCCYSSI